MRQKRILPLVFAVIILLAAVFILPRLLGDGEPTPSTDPSEQSSEQNEQTPTPDPGGSGETAPEPDDRTKPDPEPDDPVEAPIDENGVYDSKDDVALYINTYGHLPKNYITKKEAQALGWSGGSLEKYAPGKCIGGDYFGNYEELLPEKKGRKYTECDIDTLGAKSRGSKRIIFSNDGLIYYTDDHYESFVLLYGEE